jgi:hypothetical protein
MAEVVGSIRRVTDIMGEISAASNEQASGVASVGEAVMQMDQATQQNAALVEQMAAAAASLNSQAQDLVQTVAVFKGAGVGYGARLAPTPRRAAPAPLARPVARPAVSAKPRANMGGSALQLGHAKPKPTSNPAPQAKAAPPAAPAKAADDEWETF